MLSGWTKFENRDWDCARNREASVNMLVSPGMSETEASLLTFREHGVVVRAVRGVEATRRARYRLVSRARAPIPLSI